MDAIALFLLEHARTHSAAIGADAPLCLEDYLLAGLDDARVQACAQPGFNSLAWLLWHMARTEDVGINVVIAGRPQVLVEEDWAARLGLAPLDIGTGMSDAEVAGFSAHVDVPALRAYRAAVGRRTRAVAMSLQPADLDRVLDDTHLEQAATGGAFTERSSWVGAFWRGKTVGWLLTQLGTNHNAWHLGEAALLKQLAGLGRGR